MSQISFLMTDRPTLMFDFCNCNTFIIVHPLTTFPYIALHTIATSGFEVSTMSHDHSWNPHRPTPHRWALESTQWGLRSDDFRQFGDTDDLDIPGDDTDGLDVVKKKFCRTTFRQDSLSAPFHQDISCSLGSETPRQTHSYQQEEAEPEIRWKHDLDTNACYLTLVPGLKHLTFTSLIPDKKETIPSLAKPLIIHNEGGTGKSV